MIKSTLALSVALLTLLAVPLLADEPAAPKRLLLLGQGPDGHPQATHEYFSGLKIVKKCLDRVKTLDAVLVEADEPFRAGPDLIDKADGVVLFLSEGAKWMQQEDARLAAFQRLAARGGAFVGLHWATGCREARYIEKYVQLLGGCHGGPDRKYAVVTATTEIADATHPVVTAIAAVMLEDEFYYRLKFAKPEGSITPLLRVPIDGEPHTVAWAWERPDKGRSFGFTGLHFHRNWSQPGYRRLVAQGIVWSLRLPVPAAGLDVEITDDDLKLPER